MNAFIYSFNSLQWNKTKQIVITQWNKQLLMHLVDKVCLPKSVQIFVCSDQQIFYIYRYIHEYN